MMLTGTTIHGRRLALTQRVTPSEKGGRAMNDYVTWQNLLLLLTLLVTIVGIFHNKK